MSVSNEDLLERLEMIEAKIETFIAESRDKVHGKTD